MIVLKNQLVLQFSLGEFTDFIQMEDFKGMEIIEHSGGLRPIINLSFLLMDKEIIPYINQGNIISLRYGIEQLSNESLQFEIQGDDQTQQYQLGSQVTIRAAFYNNSFTDKRKTNKIEGRSYEALKQIAEKVGMSFKTNVTRTNDKQIWYQDGKTDWVFSKYIADRAYKDDSTFFSYAFDCNNFYFYDVRELLTQKVKWVLSCRGKGTGEYDSVVNIGYYKVDGHLQGQMSTLAGKNVTTIGYNVDTGDFLYPKHKLKTFTTLGTNSINMNSTDCNSYNYMITSGRDHENTLLALNQNRRNNILFSSYTVRTSVPGQYRDFRLLDTVQLIPAERDLDAEGFYLITGIVRQYSDGIYRTNLTLNRESANNIKGNLEQGEK